MTADYKRGFVTVWLVQHAGFPQDGEKSQGAFVEGARRLFVNK
jgi:hypothetical protein